MNLGVTLKCGEMVNYLMKYIDTIYVLQSALTNDTKIPVKRKSTSMKFSLTRCEKERERQRRRG